MDKAIPASIAGRISFLQVPAKLKPLLSAIWVHQLSTCKEMPVIVVADGQMELQWLNGVFRIAGPDSIAQHEFLPAGAKIIGFRFQPGILSSILGIPAHQLVNKRIAIADLGGKQFQLLRGLHNLDDSLEIIPQTIARLKNIELSDATGILQMSQAFKLVSSTCNNETNLVPRLCGDLAMSERTLRRRFREHFGYGPKTLSRILRLQKILDSVSSSVESMASLALAAGYSDQAHLIRECKLLAGYTPQYFRKANSELPTWPQYSSDTFAPDTR